MRRSSAERGERLSADTIASLAAAFDLHATDLTSSEQAQDNQPYLPLETIRSGRQLVGLIGRGESLNFGFVELSDLGQAKLVEQLQAWCSPLGPTRIPAGAVAQVKLELEALRRQRGGAAPPAGQHQQGPGRVVGPAARTAVPRVAKGHAEQ